jgi:hypothetical protein
MLTIVKSAICRRNGQFAFAYRTFPLESCTLRGTFHGASSDNVPRVFGATPKLEAMPPPHPLDAKI